MYINKIDFVNKLLQFIPLANIKVKSSNIDDAYLISIPTNPYKILIMCSKYSPDFENQTNKILIDVVIVENVTKNIQFLHDNTELEYKFVNKQSDRINEIVNFIKYLYQDLRT